MIASGKLTPGEPLCTIHPYPYLCHQWRDHEDIFSCAWPRIPLLEVRRKLLEKQEKFLHLLSDREVNSMSEQVLRLLLHNLSEDASMTTEELKECVN